MKTIGFLPYEGKYFSSHTLLQLKTSQILCKNCPEDQQRAVKTPAITRNGIARADNIPYLMLANSWSCFTPSRKSVVKPKWACFRTALSTLSNSFDSEMERPTSFLLSRCWQRGGSGNWIWEILFADEAHSDTVVNLQSSGYEERSERSHGHWCCALPQWFSWLPCLTMKHAAWIPFLNTTDHNFLTEWMFALE